MNLVEVKNSQSYVKSMNIVVKDLRFRGQAHSNLKHCAIVVFGFSPHCKLCLAYASFWSVVFFFLNLEVCVFPNASVLFPSLFVVNLLLVSCYYLHNDYYCIERRKIAYLGGQFRFQN
jgi:hypothetical protein